MQRWNVCHLRKADLEVMVRDFEEAGDIIAPQELHGRWYSDLWQRSMKLDNRINVVLSEPGHAVLLISAELSVFPSRCSGWSGRCLLSGTGNGTG